MIAKNVPIATAIAPMPAVQNNRISAKESAAICRIGLAIVRFNPYYPTNI